MARTRSATSGCARHRPEQFARGTRDAPGHRGVVGVLSVRPCSEAAVLRVTRELASGFMPYPPGPQGPDQHHVYQFASSSRGWCTRPRLLPARRDHRLGCASHVDRAGRGLRRRTRDRSQVPGARNHRSAEDSYRTGHGFSSPACHGGLVGRALSTRLPADIRCSFRAGRRFGRGFQSARERAGGSAC